jgi:NAD(P)-dependent dehydrogenase (short-subunit alcohol dehydrogenase family)
VTQPETAGGERQSRRTVLITGAASGIGAALARRLAGAGETELVLVDRDEAGAGLARELGAEFVAVDLSDAEAPERLAAAVEHLDGLVNVAGIADRSSFPAVAAPEWDAVLTVNARAPFLLTQALAERFPERGGAVVNVGSVAGHMVGVVGGGVSHAYSASKAAVSMLTKTLACELAPRRIRVNCISPGFVRTPIIAELQGPESRVPALTPVGRWGEPEEIAAVAAFLLGADSSFLTGADLVVDGGLSLAIGGSFPVASAPGSGVRA